jgi:hypothetical protein
MKKVIGIVVGALVCSLAATAFAGESTEPIGRIGVTDSNLAVLTAADGVWDGGGCADNGWLAIDTSTESGRLMYQTALTAYLAGRQIKAFYSGCNGSYPRAFRIDIVGS